MGCTGDSRSAYCEGLHENHIHVLSGFRAVENSTRDEQKNAPDRSSVVADMSFTSVHYVSEGLRVLFMTCIFFQARNLILDF